MQNYGAPYIKGCLSLANLFIGLSFWAPDHGRPIRKISKLICIKFVEVLMGSARASSTQIGWIQTLFLGPGSLPENNSFGHM